MQSIVPDSACICDGAPGEPKFMTMSPTTRLLGLTLAGATYLGDELAETGTSLITALLIAAGLLLAGVAFLLVRRARGPRE